MSEDNTQKFDPVKEFITLRDNLTRTIGEGLKSVTATTGGFPAVDIYITDESLVIRTEPLLGINAASIEVGMEDDLLVISGETQDTLDVPADAFITRELRFGPFSRSIRVPRKINAQEAKASLKEGVLTVTMPILADRSSQVIEVTPAED